MCAWLKGRNLSTEINGSQVKNSVQGNVLKIKFKFWDFKLWNFKIVTFRFVCFL